MSKSFLFVTAAVILSACSPADLLTLRKITADDAVAYIEENHARRKELRQARKAVIDAAIVACKENATSLTGDEFQSAMQDCIDLVDKHMPRLATVEAIKEGVDSFEQIRDEIDAASTGAGVR